MLLPCYSRVVCFCSILLGCLRVKNKSNLGLDFIQYEAKRLAKKNVSVSTPCIEWNVKRYRLQFNCRPRLTRTARTEPAYTDCAKSIHAGGASQAEHSVFCLPEALKARYTIARVIISYAL